MMLLIVAQKALCQNVHQKKLINTLLISTLKGDCKKKAILTCYLINLFREKFTNTNTLEIGEVVGSYALRRKH
jgi:hypothetical protein